MNWVRSKQPGGGKSLWHLLHSYRTNYDHHYPPFYLVYCGEVWYDVEVKYIPDQKVPERLDPQLWRSHKLSLPGVGNVCHRCFNVARAVTNSNIVRMIGRADAG